MAKPEDQPVPVVPIPPENDDTVETIDSTAPPPFYNETKVKNYGT